MHAVGKGADYKTCPPTLLNLTYYGNPDKKDDMIAFCGKGVIFDTGGLNIKLALLELMYLDKGGACAVLAATLGAIELGINIFKN